MPDAGNSIETNPQSLDKLLVGLFIVAAIVSLSTSAYLWNKYFHRTREPSKEVRRSYADVAWTRLVELYSNGKNSPKNLISRTQAIIKTKTNGRKLSVGLMGTIDRLEGDTIFVRGDAIPRGKTEPLVFPVLVTEKTDIIKIPLAPSPIPTYPLPETLDASLRLSKRDIIAETRVYMYVHDPDDELENYDGTIEMKKKPEALLIIILSTPPTSSPPPSTPSVRFSNLSPEASPSAF